MVDEADATVKEWYSDPLATLSTSGLVGCFAAMAAVA